MKTMSEVIVLFEGYSKDGQPNEMLANCSCTLIKGAHNIIVDTMTAWDSEKILKALKEHDVSPQDIKYVVSTHGHSDHIGNNNLFLQAKHLVGFNVSFADTYYIHPFEKGEVYIINNSVKVIPTPGHTLSDVTVLVKNQQLEIVAITGDLFEKFEDIQDPSIWVNAGSESPVLQKKNRSLIAGLADWIIPGHGSKFKVTDQIRESLKRQIAEDI